MEGEELDTLAQAPDPRSDAQLLDAYRDGDGDGRALPEIFRRYSHAVLSVLEAEGMTCDEADAPVGAVFIRALNREPGDDSLRDALLAEARSVAHDPDWLPS